MLVRPGSCKVLTEVWMVVIREVSTWVTERVLREMDVSVKERVIDSVSVGP